MVDAGEAVLDAILLASHVEHVGHVAGGGSVAVAQREAKLDAVVGQYGVDAVRHGGNEGFEEGGYCDVRGTFDQLGEGELPVRSMATKR